MERSHLILGGAAAIAAFALLSKRGGEGNDMAKRVDDRVTALITALGNSVHVIQTLRSPEAQQKAINSGASQWSGDPAKAPHPNGLAVDMQPVNPPAWGDEAAWAAWAEDVASKARELNLNPRWGGHWYPIQDGNPRLLIGRYKEWKAKRNEKPFWDPVHWDFPNDGGGVFMSPAGYRRAKQSEVTPAMMADASASLSLPIGSFVIRDGYAIGLEHHVNTEKGRHKGATVFLPDAADVDSLTS